MFSKTLGFPLAALVVVVALVLVALTAFNDDASDGAGPPSADETEAGEVTSARLDDAVSQDNDGSEATDEFPAFETTEESFVGLTREEAGALAERDGRDWRVGREDGVWLPVTDDYRVGRVTFEVERDLVTVASIEPPLDDDPGSSVPLAAEDATAAAILAAATTQLLTVDHSFGVGAPPPFSDVRVATALGGSGGAALPPLSLESIAVAVTDTGASIEFTDDPRGMIDKLFDANEPGVAVVTVGGLRVEDGRAEVDMELWCGSLCGVFLTYEAVEADGAWTITGPTGPIAVS